MMLTQCAVLGAFGAPTYSLAFNFWQHVKHEEACAEKKNHLFVG